MSKLTLKQKTAWAARVNELGVEQVIYELRQAKYQDPQIRTFLIAWCDIPAETVNKLLASKK